MIAQSMGASVIAGIVQAGPRGCKRHAVTLAAPKLMKSDHQTDVKSAIDS
jgi:hypothetical protein